MLKLHELFEIKNETSNAEEEIPAMWETASGTGGRELVGVKKGR
jgi:hypothetical protein